MALVHAILASLELQSMTGYNLKKLFDMSGGNFWTTTQGHIYKTRTDLEQGGEVEKKFIEQDDKPNRKEYSITKTGGTKLRRGMTAPHLDTRIKTAEDLGWNEAGSKYNSEGTWTVLDELLSMAQVGDKHPAQVALRWLLQRYPIPMVLSRPLGHDHA